MEITKELWGKGLLLTIVVALFLSGCGKINIDTAPVVDLDEMCLHFTALENNSVILIVNHGGNEDGNEATFFAYTGDMADEYEKLKLSDKIVSLYDFSTLVSQLIEGGVVPLESLGVPYPMANDDLFKISSIKAKGQQLLKYIELFGKKYPKNKSILKNINNTIFEK